MSFSITYSTPDRVFDRVFARVRLGILPIAWQYAAARVIEDRERPDVRVFLESARESDVERLLFRLVREALWDSSNPWTKII